MFFKIGVLKKFANFTGKHLCWSFASIKLQVLRPSTLLKKGSNKSVFPWNLRIFRNTFFYRHLMAASEMPTFRIQMRVKFELSFAEWTNQLGSFGGRGGGGWGVRTSKRSRGRNALKVYTIWVLVFYWKIFFGEQIHNCRISF